MINYLKIKYSLLVSHTSFTVFLDILIKKSSENEKKKKKKKALKMTSKLVIFRAFLFFIFRPPDPKSEKISRKSTNKKILA